MAVTAKKTSWNADKGKCIGDGKITNVAAITEVTTTVLSSDTFVRLCVECGQDSLYTYVRLDAHHIFITVSSIWIYGSTSGR